MFHKTWLASSKARRNRRGAIGKGCLIGGGVLAALLVAVLALVAYGIGKRNTFYASRTNVEAKWSEIDNQYRRRYDLIPQLVETVKGAANFEKSTLEAVTEARASVGRAQLPSNLPTDPDQLKAYIQAQQQLGGALSRLFAVAENYPQLKASQNFLSLQDQIEGTENRVTTARRDYIEAVKSYNTQIGLFPGNIVAGMFGFVRAAPIEVTPEQREAPKVQFDFGNEKKK